MMFAQSCALLMFSIWWTVLKYPYISVILLWTHTNKQYFYCLTRAHQSTYSVMSENIDDTWETWLQQFMSIMGQFIPNCTLPNRHNLPWLNKSLIKSIKKRNLLYKRAKRSGNFRMYKIACNKTLADIRSAKLAYFKKLNPRDPKSSGKLLSSWIRSLNRCQLSPLVTLLQRQIIRKQTF